MSIKGQIDIEQLLIWAYRDQCVDRQVARFSPRGPSAQPTGSLEQYMLLGTRVDTSSFAAKALSGSAPEDAIIIHDAVLSLSEIWLEWRDGDEVEIWDAARADQAGMVIEKREGRVFRVARYASGGQAPEMIGLEAMNIVGLIALHAKNGTRPEIYGDWLKAQRGRPPADSALVDRRGRARKKQEGVTVEEVAHARAVYAAWYYALQLLALDLDGRLARFAITPLAAPETPWNVPLMPYLRAS